METLVEKIEKIIKALFPSSFVNVRYSENICNSICIRFAVEPKDQWSGGYFQNSTYLVAHVWNVNERGNILQKSYTGLYQYEHNSGSKLLRTRKKTKGNEQEILIHIAKQFENLRSLTALNSF